VKTEAPVNISVKRLKFRLSGSARKSQKRFQDTQMLKFLAVFVRIEPFQRSNERSEWGDHPALFFPVGVCMAGHRDCVGIAQSCLQLRGYKVRNATFCAIHIQNASFYQDRLGTNIGETQRKSGVSHSCYFVTPAGHDQLRCETTPFLYHILSCGTQPFTETGLGQSCK
jgi:hypothetical protein